MTQRINNLLLALLVIWTPMAFFVRAADGFTLTKEWVGLLTAAGFALLALMKDTSVYRQPLVVFTLVFAFWMTLDAYGVGVVKSNVGPSSVHLWLIAGTLIAVVYACSKGLAYERLLRYAVGTGAFLSLYAFFQVLGMDHYDWNTKFEARAFATLGNPDYLGGYLVALLPLGFVLTLRTYGQLPFNTKNRNPASPSQKAWFFLRAITLLLFVGLLLTRVIGSFAALGVAGLFVAGSFFFSTGRELFNKNRRYVFITLGLLVAGAGIYLYRHGGLSVLSSKQVSIQQRLDNYQVAWAMVKDHPWTGVGLGQIGVQYPKYQAAAYAPADYPAHPFTYSEHVHNDFLQFWVEGGLVGLALFLVVLLAYGWASWHVFNNPEVKRENKELLLASLAAMAALLGQSLSNFPLQVAPTAVLFGLFLAAPLALRPISAPKPATLSPIQQGVLALGLLVVLVLSTHSIAASVALRDTLGETNAGKKELSLQYGNRLTQLDAQDPKVWKAQADALMLNQKMDEAYAAYEKAVQLDPLDPEVPALMANLRIQQGQFAQALDLCDKSLALTPNYYGPVWAKAVCLFQLKRYAESAKNFENFLLYAPNDAQTYLNLGVCYIQLHRKADAIAAWKKSYQLDPNNTVSLAYLKSVGVKL
jgi:tetratricopeptide (TPR) repeat protein